MDDYSVITHVTNIVLAVAALGGVIIAALGLRTWRQELHGRADFELARRIMRGVYELRNQIRQMRNIFSPEVLDTQYERLNNKASELDAALLEAEVLWGKTLQPQKDSLKECLVTLRLALRRHFRSQNEKRELTSEQYKETDGVLYGDNDENDQFGNSVEHAVGEFEDAIRPYLKRRTG